MATFSKIAKGTRARKTIPFPTGEARADVTADSGWTGDTVSVDVRPLSPSEDVEVLTAARAFAMARGVTNPDDGEPLYEYARQVHTLALACIDTESKEEAPKPFFDGGVAQILASELSRDHIAYLFQHVQVWQDECSPRMKNLTPEQFAELTLKSAGGDMLPFLQLRPGTQWSFTRSLAALSLPSLRPSSGSGSDSAPTT